MRLGVFAKTFPGTDPGTVMTAAAGAGFSGVQYNMACSGLPPMPDRIAPATASEVGAAARARGLRVFAVSGTWNMIHPDPVERAAGQRRLEGIAARAALMGTDLVTLCTGTRDPQDQWRHHPGNALPDAWHDLRSEMVRAVETAERHDILLGIEPEMANVVNSAAAARLLIDEVGSDRLRIVLDPANLFEIASRDTQRALVSQAVDLLADRIVMGHAKDRTPEGGFCAAGQGVVDFDHFLGALHRAGFDGPIVAHGQTAAESPAVAAYLKVRLGALGL
ncbi:MAG: sugar phosphate isomerase/epimerase [Rhodobacteraceae bacterium]|jgi:sugar phosphate isomerase/epimerase|nr:sugar phosphate isomerase/epimerase [Paracoccaceae bacterium]